MIFPNNLANIISISPLFYEEMAFSRLLYSMDIYGMSVMGIILMK
jgi:hypothetical protein